MLNIVDESLVNVKSVYFLIYIFMLFFFFSARSPVFNAMFEHEMEESKKVGVKL